MSTTQTPESLNSSTAESLSPQHEALLDVGEKIRHWQLEQIPRLSDAQILARYLELGSTRTYKRIHTGEGIEGLDADDWLAKYQSAWNKIQTETLVRTAEPVYDDLTPTVAIRAAVSRLMRETGQQRLVVVQGDTGAGKTVGLRAVAAIYGGPARRCRPLPRQRSPHRHRRGRHETAESGGLDRAHRQGTQCPRASPRPPRRVPALER